MSHPVAGYPIISADSHVTEPPDAYADTSTRRTATRAPRIAARRRHGRRLRDRRHEGADPARHRRRRRQAGRGDPPDGHALRGAAPRRLGSRGAHRRSGARRRRGRGDLSDGRHGALQPPRLRLQAGLLRRVQPLARRVLRARTPSACSASGRPRCARRRTASRTCKRDQGARPARRDDARQSGVEDYDSPVYDDFWEAAIELGLPLSFHILTTRDDARPTRGPKMNALPLHHPRLPGHHRHAGARRRLRAPPEAAASSASRPTPAGCRTTCTAWTTPTSVTATGCPPGRRSRSCRPSTSPRTSTRRSRTTGSPSAAST